MKNLNAFIFTILLSFGLSFQGVTQACYSSINVSLTNTGSAKIFAENVLEGSSADYTNLSWEFLTFDCSDIGENDYSISGLYQGSAFSCGGVIKIEDKLGPIAICDLGVVVSIDSQTDTVWLTPDLVSEMSYDNCSSITSTIEPEFVTASDIGELVTTVVTVADEDGNTNSCWTQILVQGDEDNLACIATTTILFGSDPIVLDAQDFIASNFNGPVSLEVVDEDLTIVPNNTITSDYVGQSLTYTITDDATGNSCWGTFSVMDASIVEMTCNDDVNLTLAVDDSFEVSANELLLSGKSVGSTVQLFTDGQEVVNNLLTADLFNQVITYTLYNESGASICGGNINLTECGEDDVFLVCDTKSRTTILHDCIWAHTSTDNVEWPGDFNITTSEVLTTNNLSDIINLETLQDNESVDMRDVQPRIVGGCFNLSVQHSDQLIETDEGFKVIRTWTIFDWNINNTYPYAQIIKVNGLASNLDEVSASPIAIKSNPVNQNIQFVESVNQSLSYQIVSLTGRQVMSGQIQDNINVSSLTPGYYILRVVNATQAQVIKFEILR